MECKIGMLTHLNLKSNQILKAEGLEDLCNLKELDLRNNKIDTIEDIKYLLNKVRILLKGNPVHNKLKTN